jgi:uncharacterized membrane protein YsdA (DUF1294 family)
MTAIQILLTWVAVLSIGAFLAFGLDKKLASKDKHRVPERALLTWSILGGAPGSLLAMFAFRHKIRFPTFWLVQLAALGLWGWTLYQL